MGHLIFRPNFGICIHGLPAHPSIFPYLRGLLLGWWSLWRKTKAQHTFVESLSVFQTPNPNQQQVTRAAMVQARNLTCRCRRIAVAATPWSPQTTLMVMGLAAHDSSACSLLLVQCPVPGGSRSSGPGWPSRQAEPNASACGARAGRWAVAAAGRPAALVVVASCLRSQPACEIDARVTWPWRGTCPRAPSRSDLDHPPHLHSSLHVRFKKPFFLCFSLFALSEKMTPSLSLSLKKILL